MKNKILNMLLNSVYGRLPLPKKHKSNMELWAEKEIQLACINERAGSQTDPKEWDYGCACYESAFKAYKSLLGDGHSGFSIGMTKEILNRLFDGLPLSPIEDTPDIWSATTWDDSQGRTVYQCIRMSSLFKHVADDGTVEYSANNYTYCVNIDTGESYSSGFVRTLIEKMWPITMPYYPIKPIEVYCSEGLCDPKNGDYDTIGIHFAIKANGERVEINRYFKEVETDWTEIDNEEYTERLVAMSKREPIRC